MIDYWSDDLIEDAWLIGNEDVVESTVENGTVGFPTENRGNRKESKLEDDNEEYDLNLSTKHAEVEHAVFEPEGLRGGAEETIHRIRWILNWIRTVLEERAEIFWDF